jgi:uncharacterized membrane protein
LTIRKNTREKITVRFSPSADSDPDIRKASFQIVSNDPASPATIQASGLRVAPGKVGPRLAVNANLNFGELNTGETLVLPVTIQNTGAQDLTIAKFERTAGSTDFDFASAPFTGVIAAGDKKDYQIQFKPSSNGPLKATFQVTSDASVSTAVIDATGTGTSSSSAVWIILGIALGAVVVGVVIYEVAK